MSVCQVCGLRSCLVQKQEEYYKHSKKTIFVPIEVEYHEPTDVVYRYGVSDVLNDLKIVQLDVVERELRHSSVRKLIEAEIKLYEDEMADLGHQALSTYEFREAEDVLKRSIKTLQLLANKF